MPDAADRRATTRAQMRGPLNADVRRRMSSRVLRSLAVFALGIAAASNVLADDLRMDGTSEKAFDRSYTKLVRKLSQQEQRRFALALLSALLPEKCLSSDMVVALTFLPASAEHKEGLRPCRELLNGKSYRDLVEATDAKHGGSPTDAPPNQAMQQSSRIVTPLAGTASAVHIVGLASGAPTARRR